SQIGKLFLRPPSTSPSLTWHYAPGLSLACGHGLPRKVNGSFTIKQTSREGSFETNRRGSGGGGKTGCPSMVCSGPNTQRAISVFLEFKTFPWWSPNCDFT